MNIIEDFYSSFFSYTDYWRGYGEEITPKEMMDSPVGDDGYYKWKPIEGALSYDDYHGLEKRFNVIFPRSFIEWHKRYFFLNCSCRIIDLPFSSPKQPLQDIIDNFDYDVSKDLAKSKLFIFAEDNDEIGPYVFDAREPRDNNEFPIRIYDYEYVGDLDGLSEVIFSCFTKLLECITYLLQNINTSPLSEILPEFLRIDPEGAGKTGVDFWLERIEAEKASESFDD